jgi:hypothetical protein
MKTTKQAVVPIVWWQRKKNMADMLGIPTTRAIELADGIFAEFIKKKGRRKDKIEVYLKK